MTVAAGMAKPSARASQSMVSLVSSRPGEGNTCTIVIFGGAYEDANQNLLDSSELWTLALPLPTAAPELSPVWTLVAPPTGPIPDARNEQVRSTQHARVRVVILG
jgi:hypothetical protein